MTTAKKITVPIKFRTVKHPITEQSVRIHGKAPHSWAYISYNVETGKTEKLKK